MRAFLLTLFMISLSFKTYCQGYFINYQAFFYDTVVIYQPGKNLVIPNQPLAKALVKLTFELDTSDVLVYSETYTLSTDDHGQVTHQIGKDSARFSGLPWYKLIRLKVIWHTPSDDTMILDTSLLGASPYAMYSLKSNVPDGSHKGQLLFWNGERWDLLHLGGPGQALVMGEDSIPRTVANNPFVYVSTDKPPLICVSGDSVLLTAISPDQGISYQWYKNDTLISGADDSNYIAYDPGRYQVKVTRDSIPTSHFFSNTVQVKEAGIYSIRLNTSPSSVSQKLCQNTPIDTIRYTISGVSVVNVAGLPPGVASTWLNGKLTIAGVPLLADTFVVKIYLNELCLKDSLIETDTIIVTQSPRLSLNNVSGSTTQVISTGSSLEDIVMDFVGADSVVVRGLPPGVSATRSVGRLIISGRPTRQGIFPYSATLTGGCAGSPTSLSGVIFVSLGASRSVSRTRP